MKTFKNAAIAIIFATPALALAQTNDNQANNTMQSNTRSGTNAGEQARRPFVNPDDSVVGLGPIFKNP
jgi:hypothetical protein